MQPTEWIQRHDIVTFRRRLGRWYRAHKRPLPWRDQTDPYRVWVSEVMLQQTTVATVAGCFDRFLKRFPTVADLAEADESEVLLAWQGLGYYRRARNLHKAAQTIVNDQGGAFPQGVEAIRALPGLGRYSANAVAALAFGTRLPILEANTIRLWTRLTAAEGDPARAPLNGQLWELAKRSLPTRGCANYNQALMDLGATVCRPRDPDCTACPVRAHCCAYQSNQVDRFPQTPARKTIESADHVCVVVRRSKQVLITQRPEIGPWAKLWEFPRCERQAGENWPAAARRVLCMVGCEPPKTLAERLTIKHTVMHYRVTLKCFEGRLQRKTRLTCERSRWVTVSDLQNYPFSTPQRKIVRSILDE